jgi:hypothetical protein
MVRHYVFPAALCTVVVCAAALAATVSTPKEKRPLSAAEQIQELQDRIAKLESRVAALEKGNAPITITPTVPLLDGRQLLPSQPLPQGWERREFNGQPYYFVPLGGG